MEFLLENSDTLSFIKLEIYTSIIGFMHFYNSEGRHQERHRKTSFLRFKWFLNSAS